MRRKCRSVRVTKVTGCDLASRGAPAAPLVLGCLGLLAGMLVACPPRSRAARRPRLGPAGRVRPLGGRPGLPDRHAVRPPAQARRAGAQGRRASSARYHGTRYDVGTWTSAPVAPGFALHPAGRVVVGRDPAEQLGRGPGAASPAPTPVAWMVLGRWASSDKHVRRTSVPGQSDALGRVDVDTWKAPPSGASSYQLQVRLMRRSGASSASPSVSLLGAVASRLPSSVPAVSAPGVGARGRARRAALLADGAPRRVPAVRRRRRGLVLAHLDRDGARLLRPAARRAVATPGSGRARTRGSTRSRDAPTTRLRGHRQLAVQHRLRRLPRALRLRHPAPLAGRGRVARRGRHPGHRVGLVLLRRAHGRPHLRHRRPPAGDRRLHRRPATWSSTTRPRPPRPASAAPTTARQLEAAWLGGSGGTAYVIHDDAHPLPPSPGTW